MDRIKFTINGVAYDAGCEISAETTLNTYIRDYAKLFGTKVMCREGGCGICIVSVTAPSVLTGELETFSVNSCLVSIFSCDGWAITTIEGLGDRLRGYHPLQRRLAKMNGTQCGYCTPSWIMSMYSLNNGNYSQLTMREIERSFSSNTCRCTGYRPILDTFKSFAIDKTPEMWAKLSDIEDLNETTKCSKTGRDCFKKCSESSSEEGWCLVNEEVQYKKYLCIDFGYYHFYKVYRVSDIFDVLDMRGHFDYMLIAGNTGKGVFEDFEYPPVWIDINGVEELKGHTIDINLVLGASTTLGDTLKLFNELSQHEEDFTYLKELASHLEIVAHVSVRNIGTIAGNLMVKHQYPKFYSDVFLLLETVGATLTLASRGRTEEVRLYEFLDVDMKGKVIRSVKLPPLSSDYVFRSYKSASRTQNAPPLVNAGFLLKFNSERTKVLYASVVFGGVSPHFVHATATERYLIGKDIFKNTVLQSALKILNEEINPIVDPPSPSPKFKRKLCVSFFYKYILNICPRGLLSPFLESGGETFKRPVSKGTQDFQTDQSRFPVGKPIVKLEAEIQCSGEAVYSNDQTTLPREVYAAFALASIHSGEIDHIDTKRILAVKGVLKVLTAKDIPGRNTFTRPGIALITVEEELLCSSKVLYHGQPVAIVVAESEYIAEHAAKRLKVTYKNVPTSPPAVRIEKAYKIPSRVTPSLTKTPTASPGTNVAKVIKGKYVIKHQYHYMTEPQLCVVVPEDDILKVYSSTQWMDPVQLAITDILGIQESRVHIEVKRVGGGFGCKLTRPALIAGGAALVAHLMNVPCRMILPLQTMTRAIGKRYPVLSDYEVAVDSKGKIQYLNMSYYEDFGCSANEDVIPFSLLALNNCYDPSTWNVKTFMVFTDTPGNIGTRAPGSLEGIALIEEIMEHIAAETKQDSTSVRLANMRTNNNPLPGLISQFKTETNYEARERLAKKYNENNRWKKRAIKLNCMIYGTSVLGNFTATVTIFHGDGTVNVSTGGLEIGQGLNTKVAQVCAFKLDVPLETVNVEYARSTTGPNNFFTGLSVSSESCCLATIRACDILLERLAPVRAKLSNPTWKQVVAQAQMEQINLQASHMMRPGDGLSNYDVYGVSIIEIELDILTGVHQILRWDLLEDTGLSLSPTIDVGQAEGALIQGLGYWTCEDIIYDEVTGKLLTNRTWNYHPPGALDIPLDMRIKFRYNSRNPNGVLGSKAIAEPPICLTQGVTFALREAILSSRLNSGYTDGWFEVDNPYTRENMVLAADVSIREFLLS